MSHRNIFGTWSAFLSPQIHAEEVFTSWHNGWLNGKNPPANAGASGN